MSGRIRKRRFAIVIAVVMMVVMIVGVMALRSVLAPPPPSSPPILISQYGVTTVYVSTTPIGTFSIKLTSDGYGPFFVARLIIFLSPTGQPDLVLQSLNMDGIGTVSFSPYYGTPKVVVVSSGATMGELVSSLPSQLDFLLVKDPMGNPSIVVNGGAGNGLTVNLAFASPAVSVLVSAEAIVTAPMNNTITMSMP